MPDYREFYEKDYLGAWNIPESGDLTLTISKCVQGELQQPGVKKKTKKPVVYFSETEKGLALNATNGKTIASLYGNKVEAWPKKKIALYKSMTRNPQGGDDVECLRIRPKVPEGSTKVPLTAEQKIAKAAATFAEVGVDVDALTTHLGKPIPEATKAELEAAYSHYEGLYGPAQSGQRV